MQSDFSKLWKRLAANFQLGSQSPHGPWHWKRVERNGLELAKVTGADPFVIRLFAVFHDCERQTDGCDPEHGHRAALIVEQHQSQSFQLEWTQLTELLDACRYHNNGDVSANKTIGTCWDADRLDLTRVGIWPEERYMSTEEAKRRVREEEFQA